MTDRSGAAPVQWGLIAVSGMAAGALASLSVYRSAPSPGALAGVVQALADAPGRILSSPLPVAARPEHLVLPAALVFAAVVAAMELAARRARGPLPLVPLVAVVAVPPLLGAGAPAGGAPVLALLVGSLGALLLVRGGVASRGATAAQVSSSRTAVVGLAVLAVVVLAAPAVALRLPGREPFDRREVPPGAPAPLEDPLALVNAELGRPRTEVRATVEAPPGLSLFRTTVLDRYDGVSFRPTLRLAPAGEALPAPPDPPPGGARPVTQRITLASAPAGLEASSGLLVPAAGIPTRLTGLSGGAAVRWDPRQPTLHLDPMPPPGTALTVESLVREPSDDELAAARRDRSGADTEEAARPVERAAVIAQAAADEVTARAEAETGSPDVRSLRALQAFLGDASRFTLNPRPVSGESLRHLTDLIQAPAPGAGPKVGSVTRFAAAFAVMARTMGFATRVAVGYRVTPPGPGEPYRLTNRDAFAWAEVKLEGLGWVPMIALPRSGDAGAARPATTTTASTLPARQLPAPEASTTTLPGRPHELDGGDAAAGTGPPAWALAGAGGGFVLLVLPAIAAAAAVLARRARRRRRATAVEPGARVLGAWHELLDRLHLAGVPMAASMTAAEVADATRGTLSEAVVPPVERLGDLANRARFAPMSVGAETADEAWGLVGRAETEIRARISEDAPASRPGRRRRWLDPRPPRRWPTRRSEAREVGQVREIGQVGQIREPSGQVR